MTNGDGAHTPGTKDVCGQRERKGWRGKQGCTQLRVGPGPGGYEEDAERNK